MAGRAYEQVVQDWFEAYDRRDVDAIMAGCADGCTAVYPDLARYGRDDWRGLITRELDAFPDARISNLRLTAQGDRVAAEFDWTATHTRDYRGRAATNRTYEFPCVLIFDLASAGITSVKYYWNTRLWDIQDQRAAGGH